VFHGGFLLTHEVFNEKCEAIHLILVIGVSLVTFSASSFVFRYDSRFSNPVPRASSLSITT
jgi:hypothetical protein